MQHDILESPMGFNTFEMRGLALVLWFALATAGCEIIAGTKDRKVSTAGASGSDGSQSTGGAIGIDGGLGTGGIGTGGIGTGGGGTSGTAPVPPSCFGLDSRCGPSGTSGCCDSNPVPGGTYNRLSQATAPATLSNFRLDNYEITVGRFRNFVRAYPGSKPAPGAGKNPNDAADQGWQADWSTLLPADQAALASALNCNATMATWTDNAGANEFRPINCLTWYDAYAFCIYDEGRLSTEAEWNLAAAGGSEQRVYPWSVPASSTTADTSYASYKIGTDCLGDGLPGCALADILVVGSRPKGDGRYGQADLGGNIFEMVRDFWTDTVPSPCINCAATGTGLGRVQRGGSYSWDIGYIDTRTRRLINADERWSDVGARCARAASAGGT